MAIAARWQAAHFNRPGFELFGYDVYALCGDGCLMEGVSGEAASLAGHQRLSNLCRIYDKPHLDRRPDRDHLRRRRRGALHRVGDANDLGLVTRAFETFRAEPERPTLVIVDSHIGYGSPHKHDTPEVHGDPLGEEEVRVTKRAYGWPEDAQFLVPGGVYEHVAAGIGARGRRLRDEWQKLLVQYERSAPDLAAQIGRMQQRELPDGWGRDLPRFAPDARGSPRGRRRTGP